VTFSFDTKFRAMFKMDPDSEKPSELERLYNIVKVKFELDKWFDNARQSFSVVKSIATKTKTFVEYMDKIELAIGFNRVFGGENLTTTRKLFIMFESFADFGKVAKVFSVIGAIVSIFSVGYDIYTIVKDRDNANEPQTIKDEHIAQLAFDVIGMIGSFLTFFGGPLALVGLILDLIALIGSLVLFIIDKTCGDDAREKQRKQYEQNQQDWVNALIRAVDYKNGGVGNSLLPVT
jgi:hypothetical protein